MREDIDPVHWVGQQAVVAFPVHMDAPNAGQVREELLSVTNGGATALIADMAATTSCDHAGADAVVRALRPRPPALGRRCSPWWPGRGLGGSRS
jgi:hypothetical protein